MHTETALLTPVATLVGLMVSSRINESYAKYKHAYTLFQTLHTRVMQLLQRIIAYTPKPKRRDPEIRSLQERIRRHLVLACSLVMKEMRNENGAAASDARLVPSFSLLHVWEVGLIFSY